MTHLKIGIIKEGRNLIISQIVLYNNGTNKHDLDHDYGKIIFFSDMRPLLFGQNSFQHFDLKNMGSPQDVFDFIYDLY